MSESARSGRSYSRIAAWKVIKTYVKIKITGENYNEEHWIETGILFIYLGQD